MVAHGMQPGADLCIAECTTGKSKATVIEYSAVCIFGMEHGRVSSAVFRARYTHGRVYSTGMTKIDTRQTINDGNVEKKHTANVRAR
jgi:hypothetical protein